MLRFNDSLTDLSVGGRPNHIDILGRSRAGLVFEEFDDSGRDFVVIFGNGGRRRHRDFSILNGWQYQMLILIPWAMDEV